MQVKTALKGRKPKGTAMKKQPRWLKSVIIAAAEMNVPLPFARGTRRPIGLRVQAQVKPRTFAAR